MSTYRQPGTPDIGGVGKQMEAIQSIANVFIDANKLRIKLNNEKAKRIQKENAEILKVAQIDTQAFYKGLREAQGDRADYMLFDDLVNQHTNLLTQIQDKNLGKESFKSVSAERNRIQKELNQLVQLAEAEKTFASSYIENFSDNDKYLSNQGGATTANGNAEHMMMANVFTGMKQGKGYSIYKSFEDGVAYYTISNPNLEGGKKKVEAESFLSKVYGKVPNLDEQIAAGLVALGWTTSAGSPTPTFRNLSRKDYDLGVAQMKAALYQSTMQSSIEDINAIAVDIFGFKDNFIESAEREDGKFAGQPISKEDAAIFKSSTDSDGNPRGFDYYFDSKMPMYQAPKEDTSGGRGGGGGTPPKRRNIRVNLNELLELPETQTFMDPFQKYSDFPELGDKIRDMGFVELTPSQGGYLDEGETIKVNFYRYQDPITKREQQIDDNDDLFMVKAKLRFMANDNLITITDKEGIERKIRTDDLSRLRKDEIRRHKERYGDGPQNLPPYIISSTKIKE